MEEGTLQMFKGELEKQCRFALMGIEDFSSNNPWRIWCSIHAFLVAAGNISKIFWPDFYFQRLGKK